MIFRLKAGLLLAIIEYKEIEVAKDINQDKFTEETQLKLQIFAECFREWLPVFIHDLYTKGVFIFDFFAGTGKDSDGNYGSPLILLDEAKGINCMYCNAVKKNKKKIYFVFNEKIENKYKNGFVKLFSTKLLALAGRQATGTVTTE